MSSAGGGANVSPERVRRSRATKGMLSSPPKWLGLWFAAHALAATVAACKVDDSAGEPGGPEGGGPDSSADITVAIPTRDAMGDDHTGDEATGDSTAGPDAASTDGSVDAYPDSGTDAGSDVDAGPDQTDAPEAGEAAAPDSSIDTAAVIVAIRGEDCLACARATLCLADTSGNCELFAVQTADGGPAAGESKQSLCREVLSCVLTSECAVASTGVLGCYCGASMIGACVAGSANGACKAQEEVALESTDPTVIIPQFMNPAFAGGMANRIVSCMRANGCSACFQDGPDVDAASDAEGSGDGGAEGGGLPPDGGMGDALVEAGDSTADEGAVDSAAGD
jgi:hypothetical protein